MDGLQAFEIKLYLTWNWVPIPLIIYVSFDGVYFLIHVSFFGLKLLSSSVGYSNPPTAHPPIIARAGQSYFNKTELFVNKRQKSLIFESLMKRIRRSWKKKNNVNAVTYCKRP